MKVRGMEQGRIGRRAALVALAGAALAGAGPAAAETGVTDSRIKVGQSAVFTGPAKDFGVDYKAGIALVFDKVNKGRGVQGRTLELVSDRAYVLEKGQIRYHATMAELAANEEVRRSYLSV